MYALVLAGARGSPPLCRCDLRGRRSTWCSFKVAEKRALEEEWEHLTRQLDVVNKRLKRLEASDQ